MRLGEMCLRHRVVVLSDEIHCDFVMKGQKYTPFASLPDKDIVNNSLTFKAASKTFSLAAMKTAWFFSTNPDYLARVKENHRPTSTRSAWWRTRRPSPRARTGSISCSSTSTAITISSESYLKEKTSLVKYTKAQGTYLAWLDVSQVADKIGAKARAEEANKTSDTAVTPEQIVEDWFVEHAKVQLNAGSSYGTGGAGHMRMNLATSRQLIKKAIDNISHAASMI